jgi:hypothetical protein
MPQPPERHWYPQTMVQKKLQVSHQAKQWAYLSALWVVYVWLAR